MLLSSTTGQRVEEGEKKQSLHFSGKPAVLPSSSQMKEENSALAWLFRNQAGFVWVSLNLDRYNFSIYC